MAHPMADNLSEGVWKALVTEVLTAHPEFAATTVEAMQRGLLAAIDHQRDRVVTVSMGLVEALNTQPHHVKRDHARIIAAIEASTYYTSKWSTEAIAKEQK
jgi:hypothetical protein